MRAFSEVRGIVWVLARGAGKKMSVSLLAFSAPEVVLVLSECIMPLCCLFLLLRICAPTLCSPALICAPTSDAFHI